MPVGRSNLFKDFMEFGAFSILDQPISSFGLFRASELIWNDLRPSAKFDVGARSKTAQPPGSRITPCYTWAVVWAHARELAYFWHDLVPEIRITSESSFENDRRTAATDAFDVQTVTANIY